MITIHEETYKNLVEHSPDAIIITRCGIILYINDTGVDLLGGDSKEEVVGRGMFDFLSAEYYEAYRQYISEISNGTPKGFTCQYFQRKDGTLFEAEIKGIQTVFENRPAIHLIIRDVEKRKKTEKFLLQSEKLLVAGQLAAGIAHEVRNPLTAIKGFLQLAEANFTDNKSYFDIICSEINRIESILTELLTLTKPKDMNYRKNNLKQLLEEIITLLDTEALLNKVEIKMAFKTRIPSIFCDESQLKQIFINLIKNSIEAMPNGGTISIDAEQQNLNEVRLLFTDTGSGIPINLLQRIEEPFFTTKEKGTGLGLMISKQIIENHHGRIHYHSSNKGTTVELILPINELEANTVDSNPLEEQTSYKLALN